MKGHRTVRAFQSAAASGCDQQGREGEREKGSLLPGTHSPLLPLTAAALVTLVSVAFALPSPAAEADIRRDATVAAVEKVMPAVVNIGTKSKRERRGYVFDWYRENFVPFTQELPPAESAGSGVIIDEDGWVLTNAHVIEDADEIWVRLHDNRILQAKLETGTRKSDVALLKLRSQPGEKFPAVKFAADDDLLLGETVIALGNPFGLGGSVSRGILSSGPRRAPMDDQPLKPADWLQTDASINPGNSGGPLINLRGEIIGMNVAVLKAGQGIGFAIPAKRIVAAISELIAPEVTNKRLWFGARLRPGTQPVSILDVQPESPADKAGLRSGDLLLRIQNHTPRSFFDAVLVLTEAGEKSDKGEVVLGIRRGAELKNVTVRFVKLESFFNSALVQKRLGFGVEELTPARAEQLGLSPKAGLLIKEVEPGTAAERAGLKPGMLLRGVDNLATTDVVEAAKLLNPRKSGERLRLDLLIQVQRGNFLQTVTRAIELVVR